MAKPHRATSRPVSRPTAAPPASRGAASRSRHPRQTATAGRLLTALLALVGLFTVLGGSAEQTQRAPASWASAVSAATSSADAHADAPCHTTLCGAVRAHREIPGERHAPPPNGGPLPQCPALLRPEPGAPLPSAPEPAKPPEHTVFHIGRAPPPSAGT
ncbi:hypothetical protein [Streptomyces zagrosensis]|uniref:Uncharacterized protein n=1 Tax=Streptomyces zagrosensis TaxID=1042984 RepID=A0A7W9V029_9ACTN|nr:hypothetical protein [Streptomyces zagrosensis]MBB5936359.1 hypothetical protein [Streptomyces zagrosensis]